MFALRAARLFDGLRMLSRPTLLVDGATIVASGVAIPETVPVVELGEQTLLPGLVDCHQHLCFDGNGSLEAQVTGIDDASMVTRAHAAARRALRGGVTSLRDLGDRGFTTLALKGDPSLPTILAAGPPITREGGHCWYLGGECSSESDLRRAVAERVERGCDVVKVMATGGYMTPTFPMWEAQFSTEELRLIVEEAHRAGLPVTAHCHALVGIERALDAGVDAIEHCSFYTSNRRPEPNDSILARLASSGVAISATLGRLPEYPLPPDIAANREILVRARRRLHELGATLVAGTDAGINEAKPHDVLPYAFGDFIESGLTATEALAALTSVAARACGVGNRKGRLAPGFDADVIAVAGNPLDDADALRSVTGVWRAGDRIR